MCRGVLCAGPSQNQGPTEGGRAQHGEEPKCNRKPAPAERSWPGKEAHSQPTTPNPQGAKHTGSALRYPV